MIIMKESAIVAAVIAVDGYQNTNYISLKCLNFKYVERSVVFMC